MTKLENNEGWISDINHGLQALWGQKAVTYPLKGQRHRS